MKYDGAIKKGWALIYHSPMFGGIIWGAEVHADKWGAEAELKRRFAGDRHLFEIAEATQTISIKLPRREKNPKGGK